MAALLTADIAHTGHENSATAFHIQYRNPTHVDCSLDILVQLVLHFYDEHALICSRTVRVRSCIPLYTVALSLAYRHFAHCIQIHVEFSSISKYMKKYPMRRALVVLVDIRHIRRSRIVIIGGGRGSGSGESSIRRDPFVTHEI
jgi:hypothetical protein